MTLLRKSADVSGWRKQNNRSNSESFGPSPQPLSVQLKAQAE